jgi:uncharacterized membrane protein
MFGDAATRRAVGVLALASLLCCLVTGARILYVERFTYGFFGWNLFLAWVPLGVSLLLARRHAAGREPPGRAGTLALGAVWLAFFPNAPYMVTDLIHLRGRHPIPIWFDALLVFGFAFTALCVSFVSLLLLHRLVERRRGRRAGWLFVSAVALVTGFGVYLGRFQRWNSWDLVTRPGELLGDVANRLVHPLDHPRTLIMTLVFAGFFYVSYLLLFALASLRGENQPAQ